MVVFEVGLRIAGDNEPGRLRHGWNISVEICPCHSDERAAPYVLSSFQHGHWNAPPHELVRHHRARWTTAYYNHAAIVTYAGTLEIVRLACLASSGRGRHGVACLGHCYRS